MGSRLPSKDAILAACRGFPPIEDDPILDAAAELAVLHRTREHTPICELEAIDGHRGRLMSSIDCWVRMVTPVPFAAARVHTHTMGQVIDRLAQLTVLTYTALSAAHDEVFYDSTDFLAELADGYEDLAEELAQGIRRLPVTTTFP
ncbi:DUF4254 domain-containing protein [Nocardia sp. bgisy134]|uniref:DUF4254 domain-containing protein n=1 Tax=Nocardia sp. bgisy134 TaxID=3413789 RepID=UPI003D705ABC